MTNVGTDFWIAFPPNANSGMSLTLFISSKLATTGTVSSAYPGVNQVFSVTPGIVTQLSVPFGVALLPGIEDKGIHIVSVNPISVYGLNKAGASTDAYLALPVNALGLDYRVISYSCQITGEGSAFGIVATQDGTNCTIFNHQTNSTSNITLNMGQTYYVTATTIGQDLTGSRIQSNFPVALFGSVEAAKIPAGCSFADHIIEQIVPYYAWGKNYINVPLAGRDASGDIFRILAAEDGTAISINGTLVSTINTGAYYETNLTGSNSITTSKATILAQFAKGQLCSGGTTGDPFMMLIPPREQFLKNYTIACVAGFSQHWVNLVAPDNILNAIYQDGVLIPSSAFTQIGTTGFYGAQRPVSEGSHTFSSTSPFGVFVYGWTSADSYGYPGGCSLSPVGTVNSVTITPPSASGILNVSTVCFTANVKDNFLNPVEGVLVTFHVSGMTPLTGTGYTDISGNAQYCYTQTGAAAGTDNVYAECFGFNSTTSTVNWSYTPPCVNPVSSGSIGNSQVGCGIFTPLTLTSITLPAGQTGTLEYKWQQSTTSSVAGFSDIAGSNTPDYSPGPVSQTTWFRRMARVACMTDWTGAVVTSAIEMTVTPPTIPSVTIAADQIQLCAGGTATFTATPVNGGTIPAYQWKVNGNPAGTNNPVFTHTPANGEQVQCLLTSDIACTANNPASSNTITMTVDPVMPVSVTISASASQVCAGIPVTLTATPVNGGTAPSYQWKVNGSVAGTNNPVYIYTPTNGEQVQCFLTSDINCTSNNPASSNTIVMTVDPVQPVSVAIASSATQVCAGTPVTLTATPVNGGTSPSYQWKVNGSVAGTNNALFTYTPANGEQVQCFLTSDINCTSNNPASSNTIVMTVDPVMPVSVTVSTPLSTICSGTPATFTATPVNGGTSPSYQWKVNGSVTGTNNAIFTYTPANGEQVQCFLTSDITCTSNNPAGSNTIVMTVNPVLPVSVTVSTPLSTICSGTHATFTATPVNGGVSPSYQWKVNGNPAGTNSAAYTYTPANGEQVQCFLTSDISCVSNNPATSNTIVMAVNPVLPVSVTVSTPLSTICSGTSATFTATPVNGGVSPSYQWKVNGNPAGTNSAAYTYTPANGEQVKCLLTSDISCASNNPATSNTIAMTVNPVLPVSVTVSTPVSTICVGTPVTFTANPVNGGVSPSFQWKVNGNPVGTNSAAYTYTPANGEQVKCLLTSDISCTSSNPATSNTIAMTVNPVLPVSVSVSPSANPSCIGAPVTYTAVPVNGGTTPGYQWKVSGSPAGSNAAAYTYTPANGDQVTCTLTSSEVCVSGNQALSNVTTMNVSSFPVVTFTPCFDIVTLAHAQPFILKGGLPLGGTYSGPGVNPLTGVFNPVTAGTGLKTITYTYTNSALCSSSQQYSINIDGSPGFTCGNSFIDKRDNTTYPTVLIGSQCWMAANLNYGSMILSAKDQTDNCLVEKYCYNDNMANCASTVGVNQSGGFYQWEEIMRYDVASSGQGLCPPEWHVPSESEWTVLFDYYLGNSLAAYPLQDLFANKFNALPKGVSYLNTSWSFSDFATLFWSSTPSGSTKAISHGMNIYNPSVSSYPASRANAFPVRCLHD